MHKTLIVTSSFLISISVIHAGPFFADGQDPKPDNKVWEKVEAMSDEFDGTSLNTMKWQSEPVGNGWTWDGRPPGLFKKPVTRRIETTLEEIRRLSPPAAARPATRLPIPGARTSRLASNRGFSSAGTRRRLTCTRGSSCHVDNGSYPKPLEFRDLLS